MSSDFWKFENGGGGWGVRRVKIGEETDDLDYTFKQ